MVGTPRPSPSDDVVSLQNDAREPRRRMAALEDALELKFDMPSDDAQAIVDVVASEFGDAEEVDDDELDPDVRSIFYTLEEKKLLTFRREEFKSEDGRTLRAFYWSLREEELRGLRERMAEDADEPGVYDQLPQDVWASRNT